MQSEVEAMKGVATEPRTDEQIVHGLGGVKGVTNLLVVMR
jgi:hypothetical protein